MILTLALVKANSQSLSSPAKKAYAQPRKQKKNFRHLPLFFFVSRLNVSGMTKALRPIGKPR